MILFLISFCSFSFFPPVYMIVSLLNIIMLCASRYSRAVLYVWYSIFLGRLRYSSMRVGCVSEFIMVVSIITSVFRVGLCPTIGFSLFK